MYRVETQVPLYLDKGQAAVAAPLGALFMESKSKQFEQDGFLVLRGILDTVALLDIVDEYNTASKSTVKDIDSNSPIVVFWTHTEGKRKRLKLLDDMPLLKEFATRGGIPYLVRSLSENRELRLLETIIFNKPPGDSNVLRWHQDVAYFPFEPNNQIAAWIPFDTITNDMGPLTYAVGSHKGGLRGSIDLHSGDKFKNENRKLIPENPEEEGYRTETIECDIGDLIVHNGRCWHMSGRNTTKDKSRRGLSLRYLVGETFFRPRPGSAASFMGQMKLSPGQLIDSPVFPIVN